MNAKRVRLTLTAGLLLAVAALALRSYATATTGIGDRTVTARTSTSWFNRVSVGGDGKSARLVVASTAFDVTPGRMTWCPNRVLQFPNGWKQLELVQSGRWVRVRLDGNILLDIDTTA